MATEIPETKPELEARTEPVNLFQLIYTGHGFELFRIIR